MTKVWHISRFRQRYELPDDVRYDRASPLIYTKDFVGSGSDDESCAFWRQLMALRSKKNYDSLRGNFADLKAIAGNQSKEHRGYLLDRNFQPASVKEIGQWLRKTEKQAKIIINDLRDVGLLERVELPNFNGSPKKSRQPRKRPGKSGRARKRTGKPKKAKFSRARARTDKSGKRRSPLKKKAKAKAKVKANGKDNSKVKKKERQSKEKAPPPTTQPIKPQIPQGRGRLIRFNAPSKLKNTELLGDITKKMLHKYNPQDKQFAFEIYQALALPWEPTSEQGKRELGCFASMWHKVDIPDADELWVRAVSEARKIAKRRQNQKKGAVWCHVFKNLEAARKRRKVK